MRYIVEPCNGGIPTPYRTNDRRRAERMLRTLYRLGIAAILRDTVDSEILDVTEVAA